MSGDAVTCTCPPGYEQPYCDEPSYSSVYCQINVCSNGGTCIHTDLNSLTGMKCICKAGYTGIFCETSEPYCKSFIQNQRTNAGSC